MGTLTNLSFMSVRGLGSITAMGGEDIGQGNDPGRPADVHFGEYGLAGKPLKIKPMAKDSLCSSAPGVINLQKGNLGIMRVLFVIADLYFSEPLGAMVLSGVCRNAGHRTKLAILEKQDIANLLGDFSPDVIAYSAMTPDEHLFIKADATVRRWALHNNRRVLRIMGGAHPTYFPDVLRKMNLDAICAGDGENAIVRVIDAFVEGKPLEGIPNIITPTQPNFIKEVVEDMDAVPYADRDLIYDAAPEMLDHGIRSFLTQKGCPYKCTYCFNHAYNRMFKGDGRKIMRRRSVDDLITEIKDVAQRYPVARFVRFADDVFVVNKEDEWLEEFAERYPKEVGLPFYCLIRCNALTENVARLLQKAGCKSIGMSIEAGSERVRNDIMKRNMPDAMMKKAFELARQYRINAWGNSILAAPGTTFADDMESFYFARSLNAACPTFSIFAPFPGTDLTKQAVKLGLLDENFDFSAVSCWDYSVLRGYTQKERIMQTNLAYLGQLFCKLPNFAQPLLKVLLPLPITRLYKVIGALAMSYLLGTKVFPGAQPRGLLALLRAIKTALKYMTTINKERETGTSQMRTPAVGLASPDY